jgi:hypothetical protein
MLQCLIMSMAEREQSREMGKEKKEQFEPQIWLKTPLINS